MKKLIIAMLMTFALVSVAQADWNEGWSGSVFVGYNETSGNTDKASGSVDIDGVKTWEGKTLTAGFTQFYSETDNRMDGQKWNALLNYAYDFGEDDLWFNNYQVLVDHDKFSNIDYRIVPSVGVGYHFAREEDWTWNADIGVGYETTEYIVDTGKADGNAVVILHTFAKKQILDSAFISEDLTVIPGLESGSSIRVKSETAFTNPLSEALDLEIKYIVDYDSEPSTGKTSTDKQIIAGVKYKF